jgi:hypothetical protein
MVISTENMLLLGYEGALTFENVGVSFDSKICSLILKGMHGPGNASLSF